VPFDNATLLRRSFLSTMVGIGAGLATAGTTAAANRQYVLEQAGNCQPITPLTGDVPVGELYDWGTGDQLFSSAGTTDLQEPETSLLFLYRGPDGLSLVIVHDKREDGTPGGSATMTFTGIPVDAEWVVQDDKYDGSSNYDRWEVGDTTATVDWTWDEGRTDGGALRGLAVDDLELRIEPAFGEDAALYGQYYDGEITDWVALSGTLDDPDRRALALDEPVTIRTGSCETSEEQPSGGENTDEETTDDSGDDATSGDDETTDSADDGDEAEAEADEIEEEVEEEVPDGDEIEEDVEDEVPDGDEIEREVEKEVEEEVPDGDEIAAEVETEVENSVDVDVDAASQGPPDNAGPNGNPGKKKGHGKKKGNGKKKGHDKKQGHGKKKGHKK